MRPDDVDCNPSIDSELRPGPKPNQSFSAASERTGRVPRYAMQLAVEILDHIFRLSDWGTLVACSEDGVLSVIAKRHLYHHIIVHIGDHGITDSRANYTFEPERLSRLVSEDPRIPQYVRILQIQAKSRHALDTLAGTLLMFPLLECIMLIAPNSQCVSLPHRFQAALEDRLRLPTVKELHIIGRVAFPFSLLENGKDIDTLSLSGHFIGSANPGDRFCTPPLPQLKTLRFFPLMPNDIPPWIELLINELQSLECRLSGDLFKLLKVCSRTLNTLDLDLKGSPYYGVDDFAMAAIHTVFLSECPLLSLSLHQLTLRASVRHYSHHSDSPGFCISSLGATAEAISLFLSMFRHLVIDIRITVSSLPDLAYIDFSPLTKVLASLSTPKIDIYVHTGMSTSGLTRKLLPMLEDNEDIAKSIKDGLMDIHWEKTAPANIHFRGDDDG